MRVRLDCVRRSPPIAPRTCFTRPQEHCRLSGGLRQYRAEPYGQRLERRDADRARLMQLLPDFLIAGLLGLGPRLFRVEVFIYSIRERHRRADGLSELAVGPRCAHFRAYSLGIQYPHAFTRPPGAVAA